MAKASFIPNEPLPTVRLKEKAKRTVARLLCVKADKEPDGVSVTLDADYNKDDIEDQHYAKYTPSGTFSFYVTNPNVIEMFERGERYMVTIEKIEKPKKEESTEEDSEPKAS